MRIHGVSRGTFHAAPKDVQQALKRSATARAAWESCTPLGRNEWICWIISVKKVETRRAHIRRAVSELSEGKRRPCCWAGCPHRIPRRAKKQNRETGNPIS